MKNENFDLTTFKEDLDWQSAFYEAYHHTWGYGPDGPIANVTRVVCCDSGENDGPDWLAVVEWSGSEGKFAVMAAGCDYTGWDCQAGGTIEFHDSLELALTDLTPEQAKRLEVPHDAEAKTKED